MANLLKEQIIYLIEINGEYFASIEKSGIWTTPLPSRAAFFRNESLANNKNKELRGEIKKFHIGIVE